MVDWAFYVRVQTEVGEFTLEIYSDGGNLVTSFLGGR